MKSDEKKLAIDLRKNGFSINEITKKLCVSKSSVSIWVRDVELTKFQKQNLYNKGHSREAVEKRRASRLKNEYARREVIVQRAKSEINRISKNELFLIGIGLYWAEGSKTRRGIVEFANSDPKLISVMMAFFTDICMVQKGRFRGHIHLHPHLDHKKAENYWHKVSGISLDKFFKTTQQHNKASKGKRDSLPYGTFSIYICDTELFLKIKGWIDGLADVVINKILTSPGSSVGRAHD